jgi:hypothetical protein
MPFPDFAIELGAKGPVDVLEAAAVYASHVMGQELFSRPRILHLAAERMPDLSREEALRSFGQLLRNGTLRKVSEGEFVLAPDSRYAVLAATRPD